MFGLDQYVAGLSDGATLGLVMLVAVVLGLRHATDPDHLAAVTTLLAAHDERRVGPAARLGLGWGLGHATTLFAFGVPIVVARAFLPEAVQVGAETAVGMLIVALAAWLLVRWHRGVLATGASVRTPRQAMGIGLLHGIGGSAGVGVLLLAAIPDHVLAVAALAVFAVFTAVSMTAISAGIGATLDRDAVRRRFNAAAPALGVLSLAFGVWYTLGALSLAPYVL
jgi:hypothetical protein